MKESRFFVYISVRITRVIAFGCSLVDVIETVKGIYLVSNNFEDLVNTSHSQAQYLGEIAYFFVNVQVKYGDLRSTI